MITITQLTGYIDYLGVPASLAIFLAASFLIMQVIGEFLEFTGKVVPEFAKVRKYFARKKQENIDRMNTLQEVKQLLNDVNNHYATDNITKRDNWMRWVNSRAQIYDDSIVEITTQLVEVTTALKDNSRLTEELFVQNSRDRIIDFATKVADENAIVSKEEFNRIFKVYDKYEDFLKTRSLTNGEIDIAHQVITEAYKEHLTNHSFLEDIRGYK